MFEKERDLTYICYINADEVAFDFSWRTADAEHSCRVIYHEGDIFDMNILIHWEPEWKVESKENEMISTGGANGKGYIKMKRIIPKWFYVESYLPT